MRLWTEAWITAARLRRRRGRPPLDQMHADRSAWIARHAPGKSFLDVGGLYEVEGGISFQAEDAGATAVTLLDAGDEKFTGFPAERERRGSQVRFLQGDLADPVTIERAGVHDITWCTGVIYHTPDPFGQLAHLRAVTRELLYLGSLTIPEIPGVENGCVFYPYLDGDSRAAYTRAHRKGSQGLGVTEPIDERPMYGHANFWFGITPSALRSMLRAARFEIVEERRTHETPWRMEVVARPLPEDPLLPPQSYYRERGEANAAGAPDLPWEDYYARRAGPPPHPQG